MTAGQLAERLEYMARIADMPVTCPKECCVGVRIRANSWPASCRAELREAARMLRTIEEV